MSRSASADVVLLDEIRRLRHDLDPASKITPRSFDKAATEFSDSHLKTLRAYGEQYASTLGILKRHFSGKMLHEINTTDVRGFLSARLSEGVKGSTANRARAMLSKMFEWGTERGYCVDNPTRRVRRFHESRGRVRYLTAAELDRLIAECRSGVRHPCLRQFVLTLVLTGGRRREVLALRWQDVDFNVGVVRFRAETTKSGQARAVPLAPELADVLQKWNELQAQFGKETYVFAFCGERSGIMRQAFEKAVVRAGLSDFRMHDLRHTFASNFILAGGDLYRLKGLLGHTTIQMTERYAHLSQSFIKDAAQFIGRPKD